MNRTEWGDEREGDRETGTWGEGTERERRGDPGGGREGGAEGGEGEERGGGHGCRWEEFERFSCPCRWALSYPGRRAGYEGGRENYAIDTPTRDQKIESERQRETQEHSMFVHFWLFAIATDYMVHGPRIRSLV